MRKDGSIASVLDNASPYLIPKHVVPPNSGYVGLLLHIILPILIQRLKYETCPRPIWLADNRSNSSDEHHCRCFKIDPSDIKSCKAKLIKYGFEPPIAQENHGQVFGLKLRIEEILQLHLKIMPDGVIESECEPPPEYPGAHMNQIHSFSPHVGMPALLDHVGVLYDVILPVPDSCKVPKIFPTDRPLKWWELALVLGVGALLAYLIIQALKK